VLFLFWLLVISRHSLAHLHTEEVTMVKGLSQIHAHCSSVVTWSLLFAFTCAFGHREAPQESLLKGVY
jgi:hypothetical protein